jgi:hypothetical protein
MREGEATEKYVASTPTKRVRNVREPPSETTLTHFHILECTHICYGNKISNRGRYYPDGVGRLVGY